LGVGISYILSHYVKVPAEIYSIEHVPVDLQLSDMLIIIGSAMAITFLATIYPASTAASLQTVEALRYE
jgi:lipoprotein-releasing system permease protein